MHTDKSVLAHMCEVAFEWYRTYIYVYVTYGSKLHSYVRSYLLFTYILSIYIGESLPVVKEANVRLVLWLSIHMEVCTYM